VAPVGVSLGVGVSVGVAVSDGVAVRLGVGVFAPHPSAQLTAVPKRRDRHMNGGWKQKSLQVPIVTGSMQTGSGVDMHASQAQQPVGGVEVGVTVGVRVTVGVGVLVCA
jgi:hypothetical protein